MSAAAPRVRRYALVVWLAPGLDAPLASRDHPVCAPNGNDAWSGKLERPNPAGTDGPLATLAGARNAVRRLKAQGPLNEAVHVNVAAGTYPLAETLVFEPQDSGTAQAPIVYQAAERRAARLYRRAEDHRLCARPSTASGRYTCPRSQRASGISRTCTSMAAVPTRARSPNEFYYYVRGKAGPVVDPATGKNELLPNRAFVADPKDIAPLAAMPKEQLERRPGRALSLLGELGVARGRGRSANRHGRADRRCPVAVATCGGRTSAITSRTSRPRWTRPASGFWIATATCSTFRCRAKTWRRRKSSRRCSAGLVRFAGDPDQRPLRGAHHAQGAEFPARPVSAAAAGPRRRPGGGQHARGHHGRRRAAHRRSKTARWPTWAATRSGSAAAARIAASSTA